MHDGSLLSLEAVIDHYARGGRQCAQQDCSDAARGENRGNPRLDPRVRPFVLSEADRADLIAFLDSLTDREFVDDRRLR